MFHVLRAKSGNRWINQLPASFMKLSDGIQSIHSIVWQSHEDGTLTFLNTWARDYIGQVQASIPTSRWTDFLHPDDVADVNTCVKAMGTSPAHSEINARWRRSDGTFRWHKLLLWISAGEANKVLGIAVDVHEGDKRDEMQQTSKPRLRLALAAARVGGWEWDMETRVACMTDEAAQIYGLRGNGQVVSLERLRAIVLPADRRRFDTQLSEALSRPGPFSIDLATHDERGQHRWLRILGDPLFDAEGLVKRVFGVTLDITRERKDAEHLNRSERLYRALVETTGALVWSADTQGNLLPVDGRWERFTGVHSSSLVGSGWLRSVAEEDRERTRDLWLKTINADVATELHFRMVRYDGAIRTMCARAVPIFEAGELREWFGTTTDVTEQQEAKLVIEDRSLRLAVAMGAAKVAIVSLDLETRLFSVEGGTAQVSGDEFLGTSRTIGYEFALAQIHAEDRPALEDCLRRLAVGENASGRFEFRISISDRECWVEGNALLQRSDTGQPIRIIGSVIDITERKRMELTLRDADKRKDEFLAMLAHELRNPLAPLRTVIALLQRKQSHDKQTDDFLELMQRQVTHLTRLVDDLLEVSRITQGRIALQREPLLVGSVIYSAVEDVAAMTQAHGQSLTVDIPKVTMWICGDATRLSQIFVNILNNASKYTPDGGNISIGVRADDAHITITIEDSGVGISADLLPNVFDLFAQGERTLDRSKGGLGIGLSLVRKLVHLHDGAISIHSRGPGRGTTVVVHLPQLAHHEALAGAVGHETPQSETHRALRVLIVDDNRDAADSLAILCDTEGHLTCVAYDSANALDRAQAFGPDVALLDIGLPDINGYELAERLRARGGGLTPTLIAITGYGQADDRLRAQAAGFDHHFVKPVEIDRLLKVLAGLGTSSEYVH